MMSGLGCGDERASKENYRLLNQLIANSSRCRRSNGGAGRLSPQRLHPLPGTSPRQLRSVDRDQRAGTPR